MLQGDGGTVPRPLTIHTNTALQEAAFLGRRGMDGLGFCHFLPPLACVKQQALARGLGSSRQEGFHHH